MTRLIAWLAVDLQVAPPTPARVAWGVIQVGAVCGAAYALLVLALVGLAS